MSLSGDRPGNQITIDAMQYCNWSRRIFEEMRAGGVTAVHVTVAYHENFRETIDRIIEWNRRFEEHSDLIIPGRGASDIDLARDTNRTAIFFGVQNPSSIEDSLGLVQVLHTLGIRFMQLSYNNQSLLCTGWRETEDTGITKMGREVIAEMNRVGMVIDMSHSSERSTLEAIELSNRPVAVTHAAPSAWRNTPRNKSDRVLTALAQSGGIIGLSLYPHHIQNGSQCTFDNLAGMIRRLADLIGIKHIGIGSDLCQDQPDSVLEWMRIGRWTFSKGAWNSADGAGFPEQPVWFRSNRDFVTIRHGLKAAGFSEEDVADVLGNNWLRFMRDSFSCSAAKGRGDISRTNSSTRLNAGAAQ
jgi:microsomal dipeptidase-like Zn-dependent dipeptidase